MPGEAMNKDQDTPDPPDSEESEEDYQEDYKNKSHGK